MPARLSSSSLLAAWEIGADRLPVDRALAVLWAADISAGDAAEGDLADLPLTERDRRLLAIWAENFGPSMEALATCPNCRAELEMVLEVGALVPLLPIETGQGLRPLTSRDLVAVVGVPPEDIAAILRERIAGPGLTGEAAAEANREIAATAKRAELGIRLTCANCHAEWVEVLDLPAFIWAKVETVALALLGQVASLAAAYGWAERDILALSPARRMAYLARAGSA